MKEEIFAASTKNREKKRILTSLASCVCEDFPSTLSRVLLVVKLSSIIVSRKNVQKPTLSVNSFQLHILVFVRGKKKFNSERKKLAIRPCLTLDGKRASWMTKKEMLEKSENYPFLSLTWILSASRQFFLLNLAIQTCWHSQVYTMGASASGWHQTPCHKNPLLAPSITNE